MTIDQTDPFETGAGTQFIGSREDWKDFHPEDPEEEEGDTPRDVVIMLGFDPLEVEDDDQETGQQVRAEERQR